MNTQAEIETQETPWTSLVTDNLGLAYKIAWRYKGRCSLDIDELQELALIGLVKAARAYDGTKGSTFSNFATICCTNEILCYLRSFINQTCKNVSLYTPIAENDDGETLLTDTIPDRDDFIETLSTNEDVRRALLCLDDRERKVIVLRYLTSPEMSQQKVAICLQRSQPMISRIERKALTKMRELLQGGVAERNENEQDI